ncbi:MAG: hemerythrin domain-containing protein [Planctomycetota bacterium]|jgi:hemerythrin-like domain-containing protein
MTQQGQTNSGTTSKTPTTVLKDEHRVIERVLDAFERVLPKNPVDKEFIASALDFFRSFADRFHHAKEEDELFPELERAGIPREGGPIGCMLEEHQQGRAYLRAVGENLEAAAEGDATAAQTVRDAGAGYIALLRDHIQKEDNVLFMLADQALGPDQQQALSAAFERAEQKPDNAGKRERYVPLAEDLSRRSQAAQ